MKIKTCPYCGSQVEDICDEYYYCAFCLMNIENEDVMVDGKRKSVLPEYLPSETELERSTPELMELKTLELIYLLSTARSKKSEAYGLRFSIVKGIEVSGDDEEFKESMRQSEEETYKNYEYWTKKCFVLENILRDRMGAMPRAITEKYIGKLLHHVTQAQQKPMQIGKGKKVKY